MRKIKAFITAVVLTITLTTAVYGEEVRAYDQCSGTYKTYTSEMNKRPTKIKKLVKIKESKLTSLRYLKKISTLVSEEPIVVVRTGKVNRVYKFQSEGIEGYLQVAPNGKDKLAVFKIDGKLYGRATWMTTNGIYLRMNLHDSMAKQQIYVSSTYQVNKGGLTYDRYSTCRFTEYGLGKRSREMKDAMLRYAETKGLLEH